MAIQARRSLGLLIGILAGAYCLSPAAHAADPGPAAANPSPAGDADPFPISARVTPDLVVIGGKAARSVIVSGETVPAGKRPVSIVIKRQGTSVASAQVQSDDQGRYRYADYAPSEAGDYQVTVTAPDGRGTAATKFKAIGVSNLGSEAEKAIIEAAKAVEDGIEAGAAKIDEQSPWPAKEKAARKLADAKQAAKELSGQSRAAADSVKGTIGAISANPLMLDMAQKKLDTLTDAVHQTENETERVKRLTANMSHADIGCHQLAFVTEVFKTISALLNVKRSVLDTTIGLAKDVTSDVASNEAKKAGAGPMLAFASSQIVKNLPELNKASKLAGNTYSIMADVGALVSDTLFGQYCEQFVGPISAAMNAQFFRPVDGAPTMWWTYTYKIAGRIMLYYPKSAKGNEAIRLKGRIEGYAYGFDTWEDALTVTFPKLMAGAMQYKRTFPPFEIGGPAAEIASQGSSPLSAYVEGSAGGLAAPNSFLIEVDGVLEKDSISIMIGKSVSDFNASHRVTVLILSPLTGGLGPQITWYPLPFQKAFHLFDNTANGQPMKMMLKIDGNKMNANGVFTRAVDKGKAKADYTIKLSACNVGC